MRNPIQNYAWGSTTSLAQHLRLPNPEHRPQAELWLGAHPKACSSVLLADSTELTLTEFIASAPKEVLGERVLKHFGARLPFLFKALAAEAPLSLQCHPSLTQAARGFQTEESQKIPLTSPYRNYSDPFGKPEMILALTEFEMLVGFRHPDAIFQTFETVGIATTTSLQAVWPNCSTSNLRPFFLGLWALTPQERLSILERANDFANKHPDRADCLWVNKLLNRYPGDICALAPWFLQLIRLEPGEALHLQPGLLHSYLSGTGLELMANSDNVLRAGLTPKHVDLTELEQVGQFNSQAAQPLHVEPSGHNMVHFGDITTEFKLYRYQATTEGPMVPIQTDNGPEILLCLEGATQLSTDHPASKLLLTPGDSVFITAATSAYNMQGAGTVYRATVPVGIDSRQT